MKIELYQEQGGQWRWRTCASNGRIIADGAESYIEKRHALAGALRVHRLALPRRRKGLVSSRADGLVQPGGGAASAFARWERRSLVYAQWTFPDRSFVELVVR